MNDLRELEKFAIKHGWNVETATGARKRFIGPQGQIVITNVSAGGGRGLANTIAELRRQGLEIPHAAPKKKEQEPTVAEELKPEDVARALDAAIEMINELAEEFARFRKATQESLVELRGKVRDLGPKVEAVEQIASSCIRADQLAQAVKELRAHVERVASESDPIGAFRAKLRSS